MPPIPTLPLFPILDEKLLTLLRSLSASDWEKPTLASRWKVKDIATHLLDGNIRGLSLSRDGYMGEGPGAIHSYQDLLNYLNHLNMSWTDALKRVSPLLLTDLLELTGKQYYEHLKTLDPFGKAIFSVAWAGEESSETWFHIAREYTEKWHHQQQIRYALGQEAELYQRELYFPYLDTSMRALPHHYRSVAGNPGDQIAFEVTGAGGGWWNLLYRDKSWTLGSGAGDAALCTVSLPGDIAWRIFTKGISAEEAQSRLLIEGRQELGAHICTMLAVMA
ncbi:MAG: hypothetical protein EAZ89_02040 [Bacteroidetes bacterium]|nr:MAG: hypothetical protein EAZ89_02040 [Bacteroidota bacterium]